MVIHVESQRAVDVVLDELAEARFAAHVALWAADDVVAVGEQTGGVGGRVGGYVEDVPDVFCDGEGGPLEGEPEGGVVGRDGKVDFADFLALRGLVGWT